LFIFNNDVVFQDNVLEKRHPNPNRNPKHSKVTWLTTCCVVLLSPCLEVTRQTDPSYSDIHDVHEARHKIVNSCDKKQHTYDKIAIYAAVTVSAPHY